MSRWDQPQWSFAPPTAERVAEFLGAQRDASRFSYPEVGASRSDADPPPAGYNLDHNRVLLGEGERDFAAACQAIRAWRMFPAAWTSITPVNAPISPDQVVAMQAHAVGFWWLNACRIVYVVDETAPIRRFGFAYGTLTAHVEQGEERFTVELHPDGSVWYDLKAFSRPRYWPVRLAKPLARKLQRRFVRDSQRSMQAAVREMRTAG